MVIILGSSVGVSALVSFLVSSAKTGETGIAAAKARPSKTLEHKIFMTPASLPFRPRFLFENRLLPIGTAKNRESMRARPLILLTVLSMIQAKMKKTELSTRAARTRAASLERREAKKRELRERILGAAGEEFLEHGPENFSLRRVAERIGYSPTTIYLYFQNKEALLLSTVEDGFKNFDQTIADAVSQAKSAPDKLEALGRAYIAFGLDNAALYRLMFMQPGDDFLMPRLLGSGTSAEDLEAAQQPLHHRVVAQELLVAAVREGIAAGSLRSGDPILLADALWAGVHGLVSLALSPLMTPQHARKIVAPLLRTLIDGLKA